MFVCDGGCLQVYKDLQFLVEILYLIWVGYCLY